jgi:putative MATE family efflux protein
MVRRKIRKEILALALPIAISNLLERAVHIVDIFLVGGLGASAIAAVGLAQLMVFFVMSLVQGITLGTLVVVAQMWGAGKREEAARTSYQSVMVGSIIGIIFGMLGIVLGRQGSILLGAEAEVVALAHAYLLLIFSFFIFPVLVSALSAIIQGTGDTRTPMFAVLMINVLHVVIAYPLIYGKLGLPQLGIQGAAIAVGLSELCGAAFLLAKAIKKGLLLRSLRPELTRRVLWVGFPITLDRILQNTGQIFYAKVVLLYGTITYAAHQVGLAIEALSFMPGAGFAVAAATAVGQSLGANNIARAKIENYEANRLAVIVMAGMGIIFFFFPYLLLRAFTSDPEVISLGSLFLKIVAVMQIPLAITMVLSGSLKGAGDTRFLVLVTLAGMWVVRLPMAFMVAAVLHLGIAYVWGVMVLDWVTRMGVVLARYRSERWQEIRLVQE